ncbi:putative transcription factor GeBP family [Helianthus debilis subsp. tardiflorus]
MDFTPPSNSKPPIQASPISSIPSSRKLPIKRKNPNSSNSTLILTIPEHHDATPSNPPFKFHRIWSEPDEIRLLQGLLDSSHQGFSFPKDLGTFYAQFTHGMPQPYSKSQLSEKLRRLRKKFRVISSRLANGLDRDLLSVQDRALYDLSKQLWEPEQEQEPEQELDHPSLRFSGIKLDCNAEDDNELKAGVSGVGIGVEVPETMAVLALPSVVRKTDKPDNCSEKYNKGDGVGGSKDGVGKGELEGDVKVVGKEVRVENVKKGLGDDLRSGIVRFASTTLVEVIDRSLKEMRMMIDVRRVADLEKEMSFEKRWRDQRVAEFDVLAKRLKLIVEGSSMVGK